MNEAAIRPFRVDFAEAELSESGAEELGRTRISKLIYYNKVDKGGHFAAWEQPKLFSEEVRAGFRTLRS